MKLTITFVFPRASDPASTTETEAMSDTPTDRSPNDRFLKEKWEFFHQVALEPLGPPPDIVQLAHDTFYAGAQVVTNAVFACLDDPNYEVRLLTARVLIHRLIRELAAHKQQVFARVAQEQKGSPDDTAEFGTTSEYAG